MAYDKIKKYILPLLTSLWQVEQETENRQQAALINLVYMWM